MLMDAADVPWWKVLPIYTVAGGKAECTSGIPRANREGEIADLKNAQR